MTKKNCLVFLISLLLLSIPFSGEFFIDIPRGIGFTMEYSRIVRQFGVEKNQQVTDYAGKWDVVAKIEPPHTNLFIPFEVPTIIRLANGITISDSHHYGTIYLKNLGDKEDRLSEKLYETDSITFCSFPWEFSNGYLEIKNRDYQMFLPIYVTNLGYQNKLDELMGFLRTEKDGFRILLDEELTATPPKKHIDPPVINLKIPLMSKKVKMVRARLGEEMLLMEYTDGIWNTTDSFENDTSFLFEALVPGTYTVKFTSTDYIMDYFITVK